MYQRNLRVLPTEIYTAKNGCSSNIKNMFQFNQKRAILETVRP